MVCLIEASGAIGTVQMVLISGEGFQGFRKIKSFSINFIIMSDQAILGIRGKRFRHTVAWLTLNKGFEYI